VKIVVRILNILTLLFGITFLVSPAYVNEPVLPVEFPAALDKNKVVLGKLLFHEEKLSIDGSISCASCHDLDFAGVDNNVVSIGVSGKKKCDKCAYGV